MIIVSYRQLSNGESFDEVMKQKHDLQTYKQGSVYDIGFPDNCLCGIKLCHVLSKKTVKVFYHLRIYYQIIPGVS